MSATGLASFIAGFGTGYINARDKEYARQRQAKLDQIVLDQADRAKAEAARQDAYRAALAQAAAPVVPQAGTRVTDASGNANLYGDDQAAQWAQQQAQQEAALSGSGAAPTAGQTALRYGVTGAMGKPMIADQSTAQAAADAANNPQARMNRIINVMMGYDPAKAMALQQQNVQTQAAQRQLDLSEKSEKEKDAYRQMVSTVATGTPTDIENALNKYQDGNTYKVQGGDQSGWIVSSYGSDGRPLGNQAFKSRMDMAGMALSRFDPTKWIDMQADKAKAEQVQRNSDRLFDLQKTQGDRSYALQAGAQARAARADAERAAQASAKADAAAALYQQNHPGATPAELNAVRTGVMSAIPQADGNAPAEVKLANAYVQAGLASNMKDALRMATTLKDASPEKIKSDLYGKALAANFGDAAKAREATEQGMNYLFPQSAAPAANIPRVTSPQQLQQLPKGTRYLAPDGTTRVRQ